MKTFRILNGYERIFKIMQGQYLISTRIYVTYLQLFREHRRVFKILGVVQEEASDSAGKSSNCTLMRRLILFWAPKLDTMSSILNTLCYQFLNSSHLSPIFSTTHNLWVQQLHMSNRIEVEKGKFSSSAE